MLTVILPAWLRVVLFWVGYLAVLYVSAFARPLVPPAWSGLVWGGMSSALLLMLARAFRRVDPLGAPRDDGHTARRAMRDAIRDAMLGLALGVAWYWAIFLAVQLLAGDLRVTTTAPPTLPSMLLIVATTIALATMEELGFRDDAIRRLEGAYGDWVALGLTALAFASTHILFGWRLQPVLLGVLPSGLLFGACALLSRGVAMPIGAHVAINLSHWVAGETGNPGFLTIAPVDPADTTLAARTPWIGAAVTLAIVALLLAARRRRQAAGPGSSQRSPAGAT